MRGTRTITGGGELLDQLGTGPDPTIDREPEIAYEDLDPLSTPD